MRLPAIQIRQRNIGDGRGLVADINDFTPGREHAARFVFASPPCVCFSTARNRRRSAEQLALDEKIKNLGIVAIEKAMQIPCIEFYCMENVSALLSREHFPWLEKMIETLTNEYGCSVEATIYDARDFGLCQARQRLFLVASRSGKRGLLPCRPFFQTDKFGEIADDDPASLITSAYWKMSTYATAKDKELAGKGKVDCPGQGQAGQTLERASEGPSP